MEGAIEMLCWPVVVAGLGLIIGSFLNVVILRLPVRMEWAWRRQAREVLELDQVENEPEPPGIVVRGSHCPHCDAPIRPWHNIPLLGYAMLRGRCASCKAHISWQYPLVELLTGLLFLACLWRFGATSQAAWAMAFTAILVAGAGIDFRTQLLPDSLTLPLLWLGLLLNCSDSFVPLRDAVIGAAAGYLSLWSVFWLFKLITGKEGMGYGDFKLLAALGAWMGWQSLLGIILLSSVVGAVLGGAMLYFKGKDRDVPIPFGPFLAAAGWLMLIIGPQLAAWQPIFALG
ncbi:MAG: prepilin peptidase [Xanthomonadales bacterium]|nr:prepilin peptidase [Xanthomonadales bacterium]MCB1641623.1 prepilin peptidase [Xanthomonadales bacterium]